MADKSKEMRDQILLMMKRGDTRKDIARALGVSTAAIAYHITILMKQYNVDSSIMLIIRMKQEEEMKSFVRQVIDMSADPTKCTPVNFYKYKTKFQAAELVLKQIIGFFPPKSVAYEECTAAFRKFHEIDMMVENVKKKDELPLGRANEAHVRR
jgi:Bacterial regulatory proteins, luxR family